MPRKPLESNFQKHIIDTLGGMLPGCLVLKNDSSYMQGVPDLLVLWKNRWATLEVKRSIHEVCQPNQEYYITLMNNMSFSAMICPENEQDVLHALHEAFRVGRLSRLSQC